MSFEKLKVMSWCTMLHEIEKEMAWLPICFCSNK